MNIKIFYSLILVSLLILSQSCLKKQCLCALVYTDSISVKFVNSQGQSLFAGFGAIYSADSLKILNTKNNLDLYNGEVLKDPTDSAILNIRFYPRDNPKNYIYYNIQTPQDSIELITVAKTADCCGTKTIYKEIIGVKFNNVNIRPVNGKFIFVR